MASPLRALRRAECGARSGQRARRGGLPRTFAPSPAIFQKTPHAKNTARGPAGDRLDVPGVLLAGAPPGDARSGGHPHVLPTQRASIRRSSRRAVHRSSRRGGSRRKNRGDRAGGDAGCPELARNRWRRAPRSCRGSSTFTCIWAPIRDRRGASSPSAPGAQSRGVSLCRRDHRPRPRRTYAERVSLARRGPRGEVLGPRAVRRRSDVHDARRPPRGSVATGAPLVAPLVRHPSLLT